MKYAEDDALTVLETQLTAFFREADEDGDETVSWEEFNEHLDHPIFLQCLHGLNLPPERACAVFRQLDADNSGSVDMHEFVGGCVKLARPVQTIDLWTLMGKTENA